MNKKELTSLLKRDLLKLAKKKKIVGLKDNQTKDEIIKVILKTQKNKKPSVKKSAKKTKAVAKKSAKRVAKAVVKKSAKKVSSKTNTKVTKPTVKKTAKKITKAVAKKSAKKVLAKTNTKVTKLVVKKTTKKITKAVAKKPAKKVAKKPTKKVLRTPKAGDGFAVEVSKTDKPLIHTGIEEIVSDSKYHIADKQGGLYTDNNIPHRYEDDRIFLFVRDPQTLFTAWDIYHETIAITAKNNGINVESSSLILRLYDITDINFNGYNAHNFVDTNIDTHHGSWYLNNLEDDRKYIVEVGILSDDGKFAPIARSNMVGTPRASVSERIDEEWMVADEQFWKFYALSGGFSPQTDSSQLPQQMQKKLLQHLSSMSSGSLSQNKKDDGFFFRLNCELVLYGQTEPDASLTLKGEKVNLNNDGTFSARYALEDGLQIIEAEAESKDKRHRKSITPTVSRSTASFENHADNNGEENE